MGITVIGKPALDAGQWARICFGWFDLGRSCKLDGISTVSGSPEEHASTGT
jgi:hypothetical protein